MKNIIIIVVDAFRPKNLSLYGYNKETDKNLKNIAQEGIVLRNFFSSSNATAPSLMSIFTGMFPNNHGIIHQFPYTTEEETAKMHKERDFWLPSYLKNKGYQTIAIDWIGMFFKHGFDYYKEREDWQGETSGKFSPAEDTMNLAIAKMKEADKPFFSLIHFWDTHFPFPTIEYNESLKQDVEETLKSIKGEAQKKFFRRRAEASSTGFYSIENMIAKYDEAIKEVDKQVGKLERYLKDQGLWEETILIVLGDHGTNLTEHNIYFSSSSLFDETIHVPFIAHIPGLEQKDVDGFAQNVDIAPTILELLKEEKTWSMDGKSIINLIEKNEEIRDKVLFFDGLSEDVKGVRTKKEKIITAKNPKCYLCKSSHHQEQEITKVG